MHCDAPDSKKTLARSRLGARPVHRAQPLMPLVPRPNEQRSPSRPFSRHSTDTQRRRHQRRTRVSGTGQNAMSPRHFPKPPTLVPSHAPPARDFAAGRGSGARQRRAAAARLAGLSAEHAAQHSRRKRCGSCTSSLMRLRKVTASLPSMSRWSYVRAMYIIGRISTCAGHVGQRVGLMGTDGLAAERGTGAGVPLRDPQPAGLAAVAAALWSVMGCGVWWGDGVWGVMG